LSTPKNANTLSFTTSFYKFSYFKIITR